MKIRLSGLLVVLAVSLSAGTASMGQNVPQVVAGYPVNYDEALTGTFELPDLLTFRQGETVDSPEAWFEKRRPEILALFREHQFGSAPGREALTFRVFDSGTPVWGGKALRKQVTLYFTGDTAGPKADLLLYLPAGSRKPVSLFFHISFLPNTLTVDDPGVRAGTMWNREGQRVPVMRTQPGSMFPVEQFLDEGIGVATIYYGDIEPDFAGGMKYGIRGSHLKPGTMAPAADGWGAIAAWAWGLSGALDYLETDPAVDARRVA
ncbi:MAG TPA: hypothetical protein PLX49_12025, partial [Prolixibacteraceae bacterium]|nr:hypothetical protein [Prolixibacteraceae bacterium]